MRSRAVRQCIHNPPTNPILRVRAVRQREASVLRPFETYYIGGLYAPFIDRTMTLPAHTTASPRRSMPRLRRGNESTDMCYCGIDFIATLRNEITNIYRCTTVATCLWLHPGEARGPDDRRNRRGHRRGSRGSRERVEICHLVFQKEQGSGKYDTRIYNAYEVSININNNTGVLHQQHVCLSSGM